MVPCIAVGDSIAVGVGQARPECEVVARVGITSGRYVASLLPRVTGDAGIAVISLGVNDGDTADTPDNLRAVRARVRAATVVWLLPGLKPDVREMIRAVAAENGDRTLDTIAEVGPDRLHPTRAGYERLAAASIGGSGEGGASEVAYAPEAAPAPRARRRAAHFRTSHGVRAAAAAPRASRGTATTAPAARRASAHVASGQPAAAPPHRSRPFRG